VTRIPSFVRLGLVLLCSCAAAVAGRAQTATGISQLFYTGQTSTGALQGAGQQDANWTVTYASTDGGTQADSAYEGAAYVITPAQIASSGYTQNTTQAQWITAPGATTGSGANPNTGGDYLPGNGNTGANEGIYIYTLAFTISGTGAVGTTVSNQIQITMTMAADDQYAIYVNPSGNGTTVPTGTAAASQTSAWSNTTQISLQNYGPSNNSVFHIGVNYIVVVVDNTNSVQGSSTSTATNASGLLVYQTSAATIDGHPVPEVATWLPMAGAVVCYGIFLARRRQPAGRPAPA